MWLLVTLAHAGGLALPEGESRDDWAGPLALANLDGRGAVVVLSEDAAGWWLTAPGAPRVPVPAPNDADAREAIAVLAASLLRRVDPSLVLPAPPPAPAPRRTRRPVPVPVPTAPQPQPQPQPVVIEGEILVPELPDGAITLFDPAEPAEPPTWQPWWDLGAGVAWRDGAKAGPAVQIGGGAALGVGRIGARVDLVDRLELPITGPDRGFSSANLYGGLWLAPLGSATAGIVAGASVRRGSHAGETVFVHTRALVGAELGGRIATSIVELLPRVRITADLVRTTQVRDDVEVGTLAPIGLAAELGVGPKMDR